MAPGTTPPLESLIVPEMLPPTAPKAVVATQQSKTIKRTEPALIIDNLMKAQPASIIRKNFAGKGTLTNNSRNLQEEGGMILIYEALYNSRGLMKVPCGYVQFRSHPLTTRSHDFIKPSLHFRIIIQLV